MLYFPVWQLSYWRRESWLLLISLSFGAVQLICLWLWHFLLMFFLNSLYSGFSQTMIRKFHQQKNVIIFLPIILNMCFGFSKEQSHWDGSFEYPQHMFWMRNNENGFPIRSLIWRPDSFVVIYRFFSSKINLFKKFFHEHYQFQIQIRTDILSFLIWIQTVCKGYQQSTKVKELR